MRAEKNPCTAIEDGEYAKTDCTGSVMCAEGFKTEETYCRDGEVWSGRGCVENEAEDSCGMCEPRSCRRLPKRGDRRMRAEKNPCTAIEDGEYAKTDCTGSVTCARGFKIEETYCRDGEAWSGRGCVENEAEDACGMCEPRSCPRLPERGDRRMRAEKNPCTAIEDGEYAKTDCTGSVTCARGFKRKETYCRDGEVWSGRGCVEKESEDPCGMCEPRSCPKLPERGDRRMRAEKNPCTEGDSRQAIEDGEYAKTDCTGSVTCADGFKTEETYCRYGLVWSAKGCVENESEDPCGMCESRSCPMLPGRGDRRLMAMPINV